ALRLGLSPPGDPVHAGGLARAHHLHVPPGFLAGGPAQAIERRPSRSARITLRPSVSMKPLRLNCERVSDTVSRVEPMRLAISWWVIFTPRTRPRLFSMPCSEPRRR